MRTLNALFRTFRIFPFIRCNVQAAMEAAMLNNRNVHLQASMVDTIPTPACHGLVILCEKGEHVVMRSGPISTVLKRNPYARVCVVCVHVLCACVEACVCA